MNNKILATLALAAIAAAPLAAEAGSRHKDDRGRDAGYRYDRDDNRYDRDDYRGRARVVDVDPIYERVRFSVLVEHCWNERVRHAHGDADRTGAALVGGAVGAVIGNQVGNGRGAPTVVGAIAGAVIGSELAGDGRRRVHYEDVRRCEVRHEPRFEQRVVAYHVTYELRGRRDVTRLAYNPGRYLAIADIRRRG